MKKKQILLTEKNKLHQVTKKLDPNDPFLEKVKSEIPNAIIKEIGDKSAVFRPKKEIGLIREVNYKNTSPSLQYNKRKGLL